MRDENEKWRRTKNKLFSTYPFLLPESEKMCLAHHDKLPVLSGYDYSDTGKD